MRGGGIQRERRESRREKEREREREHIEESEARGSERGVTGGGRREREGRKKESER